MSAMTLQLVSEPGRPFTVADLETMPDDGRRYELIDGTLLVSPAPAWRHQEMAFSLGVALRGTCPRELRVLIAPFAVQTSDSDEVQPDVIVARYVDLTDKNLPVAPLLAVEALSPSTRLFDLNLKRAHYERIGVPSYWVLDPNEPGVLKVFELGSDGRYVDIATVTGDEKFAATAPFPITVVPARLLDGLRP